MIKEMQQKDCRKKKQFQTILTIYKDSGLIKCHKIEIKDIKCAFMALT